MEMSDYIVGLFTKNNNKRACAALEAGGRPDRCFLTPGAVFALTGSGTARAARADAEVTRCSN